MLFSLTDPETVLGTATHMPITEMIYQATQSRAAAVVLTVLLGVCFINGTMGCITSASRLTFAMARDKGIVFPSTYASPHTLSPTADMQLTKNRFAKIHRKLDVPVASILLVFAFNLLFGLLYLGPSVAFNAFVASCTIFLNLSCAIPVFILLIRGRSVLIAHQTPDTPFKLGKWGYVCNGVAVTFVGVTTVFFCFPGALPVGTDSMNYVSGVIGIFLVLLTIYWLVYGGRFEGPVS